ncbi:MAG: inosine monophosphate cyclohydrolase [Anaerolineae bacterium]|nr:inosine monophosphate cyclohydrolase [Anaerolineae bacterium]
MSIFKIAEQNFENHLKQNSYPGRGLVVGRSSVAEAWLMIYWIMGRSQHSRNRKFVVNKGGVLRTEAVDLSLVDDPSLIIYEAMLELPGIYLVSNGDQTRTIVETLQTGGTFEAALATREREPDAPNYTPRISAMLDFRSQPVALALNILKANPANPDLTDHFTYRPAPPPPGLGLCLTTYQGDGNPLPSFQGEPLLLPCPGRVEELLEAYWQALDAENRISLAVKQIPAKGGPGQLVVRNRFG